MLKTKEPKGIDQGKEKDKDSPLHNTWKEGISPKMQPARHPPTPKILDRNLDRLLTSASNPLTKKHKRLNKKRIIEMHLSTLPAKVTRFDKIAKWFRLLAL